MKIPEGGHEIQRIQPGESVRHRPDVGSEPAARQTRAQVPQRGDTVEISQQGRALASRAGDEAARHDASPERLAAIRAGLIGGVYNTIGRADAVARRLLDEGII